MYPQLILASASPRRSQLLTQIGVRHQVHAVDLDETLLPHESPQVYVERLAAEKSALCRSLRDDDLPVLAADTTVVCDDHILGKPADLDQAIEMLSLLSGRSHQVYTAISLRGQRHWECVSVSDVKFRPLSRDEIVAYWQTGEPCDKAGSYAIQGLASIFIEAITGSFSGVMGLPLFETAQLLGHEGITII